MLLGESGLIRLDLGSGLQCSAEVTGWRLSTGRNRLETTTLADESRTWVAGLKEASGTVNYGVRLADNPDLWTAAQIIPLMLLVDSAAEVAAEFYLQALPPPEECFPGLERGLVWLAGRIILDDTTIDVSSAPELIRCASNFTATGDLLWQTAAMPA